MCLLLKMERNVKKEITEEEKSIDKKKQKNTDNPEFFNVRKI